MPPERIEFLSDGDRVRGRFFPAAGTPACTLLLVPGWPGNPDDVLGQGALLSAQGINVLMFNPRGLHQSEGTASFAHNLQDIGSAWRWLQQADVQAHYGIDTARLALGGHSHGGGTASAYAAGDPSVRRLVALAANDHGEFIREYQRNAAFAEVIRAELLSTQAPRGPARFDVEAGLRELAEHPEVYGLRENAARLADRSILMIGGWEDVAVTVDQFQLPFYRALKRAQAADVTFLVYHTGHEFSNMREQLAADIAQWLLKRF